MGLFAALLEGCMWVMWRKDSRVGGVVAVTAPIDISLQHGMSWFVGWLLY